MKLNTLSSFLCGIVSLTFLWTNYCVHSRHTRFTCEGGRGEGDKWFDGCRWCVCQLDGPLCSPASCSDLVAQVPPCGNVGSRWRDGCYQCGCNSYGIECVADESCVVLMQREEYQRQILSPGACVEPKDDRCVCGVDGVPSCTAEVIDRNAHPATTIALDSFNPSQTYDKHYRKTYLKHRRFRRKSNDREYLPRHAYGYRSNQRHKVRSSYEKPYRFYNPVGGYYNYADVDGGYPNKGYHVQHKPRSKRYHSKKPASVWDDDQSTDDESGRPFFEYKRNNVLNDDSRNLQRPKSLLIITNNRCRYGVRWYGGGLRCYCNEDGSITCGDPKFVATRIDGFRLENIPCEEGHAWYDDSACQECECKINGVVLCRRSVSCPLPFLIQPVPDVPKSEDDDEQEVTETPNEDDDEDDDDTISSKTFRKTIDRRSGYRSYNRLYDSRFLFGRRRPFDDDDSSSSIESDGSGDEKTIEISYEMTGKPPLVIDNDEKNNKYVSRNENIGTKERGIKKPTTKTVIVQECNPGSRWMDGCKRCSCNRRGRKFCDERQCPKPAMPPSFPPFSHKDINNRRPFQRPPVYHITRNKPVKIKSPFPEKNPCGRFKVKEKFWIKCNQCECTKFGPKCTAIHCG